MARPTPQPSPLETTTDVLASHPSSSKTSLRSRRAIRVPCVAALRFSYCLAKNGYNQDRCQRLVDALYDCCDAFYARQGDTASTPSCPRPDLLRLKLSQRKT
ncbi:hypothetical protein CMQ_4112 [Grosmannia clavigera kw1407]|uniref:Cx9C motif-containing protein 4, mitochondrial n=1 Tax=Grosmannia clavigera (strain kw1407 / UAMH 11150) TaxID=655863 RepID=F0X9B8_GROCL|nr:uncharacterized protein CMQ_4112 [Grosmannia clavigera kw1407]EFX06043.1 hypothetical protein CMQ_4112 [Grosmannia clavigera kw1407]